MSIRATAWLAGAVGWQWALAPLAIGPALGAWVVGRAKGKEERRKKKEER